jgi:hypothetical protein
VVLPPYRGPDTEAFHNNPYIAHSDDNDNNSITITGTTMASLSSIEATFSASMKSIGTAVTMAGVGFYLHYRKFISAEGKRTLALMSQQVTFPL